MSTTRKRSAAIAKAQRAIAKATSDAARERALLDLWFTAMLAGHDEAAAPPGEAPSEDP